MRKTAGLIILFLGVFATQAFAQRYVVFPQFASGLGWTSELYFANQGYIDMNNIIMRFYDNSGVAQPVPTNLGLGSAFIFDLGAGETKTISINSSATYQEGYIVVEYPGIFSPIRATEVYRLEQNGVVSAEVGVPQIEQANHFSLPVKMDSSAGISTAIALVNPAAFSPVGAVAQTIILSLINQDGSIHSTVKVPLESGQHIADYLNETDLFEGLDDFIGTLSISSPFGVGVLALRQDKQAFGAVSTDYGPLTAPFAVSGVITPLPEPNDTPAQAPAITNSIILSGVIDPAGDLDYVKFSGSEGDIISVRCDAWGLGSLNPVLEMYDSSLNLIAQNDQNGWSPNRVPIWDSFIQMELPADGTYYLLVKSRDGNGGPDYLYRLNINLP